MALYTETFETITVKFYGFDNKLIESYVNIEPGTHVKVPEVPATIEDYRFTGWDPPIVVDAEGYTGSIIKSVDFYAQYEEETFIIDYCIYDEETSSLKIVKTYILRYGDDVPVHSLGYNSEYGEFLGWIPEVNPICTGDATYKAKFSGISWYTLTFMDWYGNVADTKTLKEYTNVYSYATNSNRVYPDFSESVRFLGYYYLDGENKVFVDEWTVITSDLILYPDFSNPICTINFYGFDNKIISSQKVKAGYEITIPDFPEIQCYEATHWDKEVVNPPVESADYHAQYERSGYLITFLGYNNYVIDTQFVKIGKNPIVPKIPTVSGITATGKWIPEIERPATKDMKYTAEYFLGTKADYITILQNKNNIGFSTDLPWHNHTTVYVEIAGSNFHTEYVGDNPERYACLISTVDNPNEVWDYDNEIANDFSFKFIDNLNFGVGGGKSMRYIQEPVSKDDSADSIKYIKMRTDGVYIAKGTLKSDGTIDYSNVMWGETPKTGHSYTNLYTPIWIAPKTSVKQRVTYYYIKMYTWDGGKNPVVLVRHYIPWKNVDGVYCFREELTNTLHYPQVGSWSGSAR